MTRARQFVGALAIATALPFLGGAGSCGILYDLWNWEEITDPATSVDIDVDEGALDIVGYPRKNIWMQRHVYAFEHSIGEAKYGVEKGVFRVVFTCDGPATCFADHSLELPEALPVTARLGQGTLALFGLTGPIELDLGDGVDAGADELESPTMSVTGDSLDRLAFAWTATSMPTSITIDIEDGAVELTLPPGSYACDLQAEPVDVATTIVCDSAAPQVLHVDAGAGSLKIAAAQ